MNFRVQIDTFLTSFWDPLDLKKAIKTHGFLSILQLEKDDIFEHF